MKSISRTTARSAAVLTLLLLCALVAWAQPDGSRNGVDFSTWKYGPEGMLEASQQYEADPKPILLYFYTDWCGYCRQFERELLTSKELQNYLEDEVIAVRINPERDNGARISRRYGVRGFPALFVHSSESKVISRVDRMKVVEGRPQLMTPAEFIDVVRQAGSR